MHVTLGPCKEERLFEETRRRIAARKLWRESEWVLAQRASDPLAKKKRWMMEGFFALDPAKLISCENISDPLCSTIQLTGRCG